MCDLARTQHVARFISPPAPPDVNVTGESLKPSCRKKREKDLYAKYSVALRASRNIHGTACFKFVDLATICFFFFALLFLPVFSHCWRLLRKMLWLPLAPIKTLIYMSVLRKNQCELQQKPRATFSAAASSLFLHNPDEQ